MDASEKRGPPPIELLTTRLVRQDELKQTDGLHVILKRHRKRARSAAPPALAVLPGPNRKRRGQHRRPTRQACRRPAAARTRTGRLRWLALDRASRCLATERRLRALPVPAEAAEPGARGAALPRREEARSRLLRQSVPRVERATYVCSLLYCTTLCEYCT